jgi:hypothetical protein
LAPACRRGGLDVTELEKLVVIYRRQTGHHPQSFADLARLGLLRGIPLDPVGNEYQLDADGNAFILDPEHFPFVEGPAAGVRAKLISENSSQSVSSPFPNQDRRADESISPTPANLTNIYSLLPFGS